MKHIGSYILFIILISSLSGCKKDKFEIVEGASLRIVHVVAGGANVFYENSRNSITLNTATRDFFINPGYPDIYVFPPGDSLHPYYNSNKSVQFNPKDMATLFLCGMPGAGEGILVKESFPAITDSVAMIRFVNLSPNSSPVNVTLSTSPTTNQFSDIGYKQFSDFKLFPAKSSNTSYTFQIRAASNPNTVLASVTMQGNALASFVPRFRYVTIVFRGIVAGAPAPAVTRVNHYPTLSL